MTPAAFAAQARTMSVRCVPVSELVLHVSYLRPRWHGRVPAGSQGILVDRRLLSWFELVGVARPMRLVAGRSTVWDGAQVSEQTAVGGIGARPIESAATKPAAAVRTAAPTTARVRTVAPGWRLRAGVDARAIWHGFDPSSPSATAVMQMARSSA